MLSTPLPTALEATSRNARLFNRIGSSEYAAPRAALQSSIRKKPSETKAPAASDTAASASGELSYPTITFTDGADMDSWADGELAIVRVYRDHDHGDDGMTGDAELWDLLGKET